MGIRDRLAVVVAGLQQQCEDVAALCQSRVGPRIGDERVDDSVESVAVSRQSPSWTPPAEVSPKYRRQPLEQGAQDDHERHHAAKLVQRVFFFAEHGAQNGVEGQAAHRRKRLEFAALGPVRGFTDDLFFDEALVILHPFSMKGRQYQFAAFQVFIAGEAERRTGAECWPRIFVGRSIRSLLVL